MLYKLLEILVIMQQLIAVFNAARGNDASNGFANRDPKRPQLAVIDGRLRRDVRSAQGHEEE
jgi:hypothetical protein